MIRIKAMRIVALFPFSLGPCNTSFIILAHGQLRAVQSFGTHFAQASADDQHHNRAHHVFLLFWKLSVSNHGLPFTL
jgi:hypothetical protein